VSPPSPDDPSHGDGPRWRDLDDEPRPAEPSAEERPEAPEILPRPPGAEETGVPRIPLRRWNPYRNLDASGKRFINDLLRFPTVTAGIIGVLVVFYGWMVAMGWDLTILLPSRWGYSLALAFGALEPDLVRQGEWWRLFTPALLHGSLIHLAFNSFMLYQLGRLAENVFGRAAIVLIFVGSAITGCLFSAFMGHNLSLGASGAVMGMVGACIAFGLRHNKRIPEFLRGVFRGTLWFYAGLILVIGMMPGIDGWGHFGGGVGGALLGLILPSPILREPRPDGTPARQPGWVYLPFGAAVIFVGACLAVVLPRALSFDGDVASEAIEAYDAAMELERYARASRALDEAELLEPGSPFIQGLREQLSAFAMVADDWKLASLQYERMEEAGYGPLVERADWQNNYAWTLMMAHPRDLDRVGHAVEVSRASLEPKPDNAVFLNTLAWGLYLSGDHHGALATIEQAMELNKGRNLDSDVYIYVAAMHAVGRETDAIATYREAVAEYPHGVLHAEVASLLATGELPVEEVAPSDSSFRRSSVGTDLPRRSAPVVEEAAVDVEEEVEVDVEEGEVDVEVEEEEPEPEPTWEKPAVLWD
jgi:membrane associated rhomboid family serine protease